MILPETDISGHPAIQEQLETLAKQLAELQQNAQMARRNLQGVVDLQEQYQEVSAKVMEWLNLAEDEMKVLEMPGDDLKEKEAKLDDLKVKLPSLSSVKLKRCLFI